MYEEGIVDPAKVTVLVNALMVIPVPSVKLPYIDNGFIDEETVPVKPVKFKFLYVLVFKLILILSLPPVTLTFCAYVEDVLQ